jgi:hypothetical protein
MLREAGFTEPRQHKTNQPMLASLMTARAA